MYSYHKVVIKFNTWKKGDVDQRERFCNSLLYQTTVWLVVGICLNLGTKD